jgi:DNA-binding NarL/FixJ family response regulator
MHPCIQAQAARPMHPALRSGGLVVRILLAGMTNMLFQIVSSVLAQSAESTLVGRVDSQEEVASRVRSTNADVVMMQAMHPESGQAVLPLLYKFPALKIVTIATSGRNGFVHELRPVVHPLLDLSAETLHAALQSEFVSWPN